MGKLRSLWQDKGNQYRYIRWIAHYTKPYVWKIGLMMFLNLLSIVIGLVLVQITKMIIDNATEGLGFGSLIVIYLLITLGTQAISIFSGLFATMLDEKFSFGIRKQIYEKIIHSHWTDINRYHTGDLMTRLTSDASNVADGVISTIPSIIQLGIQLILVFGMLFYYSPLLAVFALAVAPVAALASRWLGRKLGKLQNKVQESESAYRSFLQESLANLLVVKAFSNEDYAAERLTKLRDERFYWIFKRAKLGTASTTVLSSTFQIGYIAAFSYGALQIYRKMITYGTMSVFLSLVNQVQGPVIQLAQQIPRVVMVLASAGRIMELQNIPLEEHRENVLVGQQGIGVKTEHVKFGYLEELVLDDVSLSIQPGEFVAVIGESGIGKTTLVRVIMSFMSNVEGLVEFYDAQGRTEPANASTREYIAYVPQGNTLFSGSIRENIRMGKLDATEEEMWEALRLSAGEEFVRNLPEGLDTRVGERGYGLSEGQAQRIAIARAFVRKAPFMILDEATSALDEQTELGVIKGLQELSPRPTCLIITHRKSILKYCDREIEMEG
ncbi:MAG: ABC transporter ATP-binding protein/permease [Acetatifactor sp.]|nr:ABC transporter ATP-binding protein/permease [Acetatifactor sp.]